MCLSEVSEASGEGRAQGMDSGGSRLEVPDGERGLGEGANGRWGCGRMRFYPFVFPFLRSSPQRLCGLRNPVPRWPIVATFQGPADAKSLSTWTVLQQSTGWGAHRMPSRPLGLRVWEGISGNTPILEKTLLTLPFHDGWL